ncbi:MAG: ATP-binding cassette domain-containing protein [Firmicutes bacterium]|nr:ATP-binding cassette domain-containing protein [Bacillota bacterium]
MIQVTGVRLQFGGRVLFDDVNIKFLKGNCYGIIGANGAGKSTFIKMLAGEVAQNKGEISIDKGARMSVLSQDQKAYDHLTALQTVIEGHTRIAELIRQREALYAKGENLTEKEGYLLGDLEAEFAELDGWDAEFEAEKLLAGLGVREEYYHTLMGDLDAKAKVKVLLAKALFYTPDILIMDEPTNNLDAKTVRWLENYLLNFENCVIIVSHNRHFLNKVTTHTCDIDYNKITAFVGNYDFWYESSQLLLRQAKDQNKKAEARAAELKDFIARFSANASKSKQATSRKKELENLEFIEMKPSSRKYPYINFEPAREVGNEVLTIEGLTKKGYFENLNFTVGKTDKVAFFSDKSVVTTMLFKVLMGEEKADSGTFRWGGTITQSYIPENNDDYFKGVTLNLVDWLKQYSKEKDITFIRGWLGRMLFSGEEALKEARVLSGGEKMRCMFSKAMLAAGNVLVLDEPTNHLDLESITALNKGMISFKGPILFTTHDEEILATVANKIVEIDGITGKQTLAKAMSYDDYAKL